MKRIALLVAMALLLTTPASGGVGTPTPRYIDFYEVGMVLVDDAHEQIFVSGGPSEDRVLVLDFNGGLVAELTDLPGANVMYLVDGTLQIGVGNAKEIALIDTETLERTGSIDTSPYSPSGDFAVVGEYVFVGQCGAGTTGRLFAVNLENGLTYDHSDILEGDCPHPISLPTEPNGLTLWEEGGRSIRKYQIFLTGDLIEGSTVGFTQPIEHGVLSPDKLSLFVIHDYNVLQKVSTLDLSKGPGQPLKVSPNSIALSGDGSRVGVGGGSGEPSPVFTTDDLTFERSFNLGLYTSVVAMALLPGEESPLLFGLDYFDQELNIFKPLDVDPVKVGRPDALMPAVEGDYFAWSENDGGDRTLFNAYVTVDGHDVRMNAPGTFGAVGNIDGDSVFFHQIKGQNSDVFEYDILSGERKAIPNVNTKGFEWRPSVSGDRLLYGRVTFKPFRQQVILRDLTNGRETVLVSSRIQRELFIPDDINGNYAVWTWCMKRCEVFRHDIGTGKTDQLDNPWFAQYSASVLADGTVYLGRDKKDCGYSEIVRIPVDGPETRLMLVAGGWSVDNTAIEEGPDSVKVYFTRYRCDFYRFRSDIYAFEDPNS